MNITITIPLSMRPVATRDTAWHVESPGTTTAPDDAEIVLAHRGQEGRVRLREIGSRLMSAWAYPISEEAYQRHLAEIAAEHEQVDAAPDDARGMAVSHVQRGWLLARLRERDALVADLRSNMAGLVDALGAIGEALPPLPLGSARRTYKQMTEEVARLTAALRDAKVLERDGTLGEMAETICHLADILRNVPTKAPAPPTIARCARGEHRKAGESMPGACADCGVDWADLDDENPEQEHTRHLANLRAALVFFEEWAEVESYGAFPGGDPRLFTPDPEASTEAERTAHKTACEAWECGEHVAFDVGPLNSAELRVSVDGKERVIPAGTAFVNRPVFGLGTVIRHDAEMMAVRDGLRAALASVRSPVDLGLHVEKPASRGVEQAERDGSDSGSDGAHVESIAAASESRKENRQENLFGRAIRTMHPKATSLRTEDVIAIARAKGDLSQVPDGALDAAIEVVSAREDDVQKIADLTREHRILLRLQYEAARRIESAHERAEVERARAANEPTLTEVKRDLDRLLSNLTDDERRRLTWLADPLSPGDDAPEETNPGAHDPAAMWSDMAADLTRAEGWHRDRAVVAREAAQETEALLRDSAPETRSVPARGRNDLHANTAWIREHGAPYRGQWVALRDGALVRANKARSVLLDSLDQSGDADVLLVKIDD